MDRLFVGSRARSRRTGFWVGLMAALTALSGPALAEDGADAAVAEALFQKGKALMEAGNLKGACPKLAESHALDPASGTLLTLGTCYRKAGKTASAWATFQEVVPLAEKEKRPEWAGVARAAAAELKKELSYLMIRLADRAAIVDLVVTRDGTVVKAALGMEVPVDPGKHRVMAEAPGYQPFWVDVEVGRPSAHVTVEVPALKPRPAPPPLPLPSGTAVTPPPSDPGKALRTAGVVIGVTGLAGLAAGAIFGGLAAADHSASRKSCPSSPCASAEGVDLNARARAHADVSTGLFGAGAVLAAAGIAFHVSGAALGPKEGGDKGSRPAVTRIQPVASSSGGGLWVGGQF